MGLFAYAIILCTAAVFTAVGLLVWSRQRTERRLAEQDLNRIIELSPIATIVSRDNVIVFGNSAAVDLLAGEPGSLVGSAVEDLFVEKDDYRKIATALKAGQNAGAQDLALCGAGPKAGWAKVEAVSMRYQDAPAILTTFSETTGRRQIPERSKDSEIFLNGVLQAFDYINDGVAVAGPDGTVYLANMRAAEIAGYEKPADFVGQRWQDVPNAEALEISKFFLNKSKNSTLLASQDYFCNETWITDKDGVRIINISIAALPDGGSISIIRNVTQETLRNESGEPSQTQLQRTRRLETVSQLAGGIVHDFNNLIGAILGFAQFIQQDSEPASQTHNFATKILTAGGQAKELVAHFASLSQHPSPSESPVDLSVLSDEVYQLLRPTLPASTNLLLSLDEQSGAAMVNGDQGRILQAIVSLCRNAHHALDGGIGEVQLSTRTTNSNDTAFADDFANPNENIRSLTGQSDNPVNFEQRIVEQDGWYVVTVGRLRRDVDYMELAVSDSGMGMDRLRVEKIFEPFSALNSDGSGAGLDLSVVHNVKPQHKASFLA